MFVIILFFSKTVSLSQNSLLLAINSTHPGYSMNLGFSSVFDHNSISFGLKYHINKSFYDSPVSNLYRKNYYSSTLIDHFGIIISYDYTFNTIGKSFYPFVYYYFEQTRSSLIHPGTTGEIHTEDLFEAVWSFDNYCGVGIKYLITDRLSVYLKGGLGASTCIKPPHELLRKDFDTELASQLNLGFNLLFVSTKG